MKRRRDVRNVNEPGLADDPDEEEEISQGSDVEDPQTAEHRQRRHRKHLHIDRNHDVDQNQSKDSLDSGGATYVPAVITRQHLTAFLQCTLCIDSSNLRAQHLFVSPVTFPCGHTSCNRHSSPVAGQPATSRSIPLRRCRVGTCATAPVTARAPPPAQRAQHAHSSVIFYLPPSLRSSPGVTMQDQDIRTDVNVNKVISLVAGGDSTQPQVGGNEPGPSDGPAPPSPATSSSFLRDLKEILTCEICLMLFYEPMTLVCGHTFCARCLQRTLDQHGVGCPICRSPVGPEIRARFHLLDIRERQAESTNKVLLGIILLAFPREYMSRRQIIHDEAANIHSGPCSLPMYTNHLAFPGHTSLVNFFEARHRLMLRRILNSPASTNPHTTPSEPRLGMILPSRYTLAGEADYGYGTLVRIKSVQLLPDERSVCEVEATGRYRVIQAQGLDGYVIGRVEMIEDIDSSIPSPVASSATTPTVELTSPPNFSFSSPPPSSQALTIVSSTSSSGALIPTNRPTPSPSPLSPPPSDLDNVIAVCTQFIDGLRNDTAPWVVQRLNTSYGDEPDKENLVAWGWWLASLLPIDDQEKAKLLPIRSAELRLRLIAHWIQQLSNQWWYSNGCCVC